MMEQIRPFMSQTALRIRAAWGLCFSYVSRIHVVPCLSAICCGMTHSIDRDGIRLSKISCIARQECFRTVVIRFGKDAINDNVEIPKCKPIQT